MYIYIYTAHGRLQDLNMPEVAPKASRWGESSQCPHASSWTEFSLPHDVMKTPLPIDQVEKHRKETTMPELHQDIPTLSLEKLSEEHLDLSVP